MARETDDIAKRKKYRSERFAGKKSTKDEYTGERIFSGNKKDALRKHPTSKTTDDDHITPLKVIDQRFSNLSSEQKKELANRTYNLALTNSKLNRSKGGMENHEYLLKQIKKGESENLQTTARMLSKEVGSRTLLRADATKMSVDNAVRDSKNVVESAVKNTKDIAVVKEAGVTKDVISNGVSGAKDTLVDSAVPLMIDAVNQMCKVASGEKELKEAAKEFGKDTMKVAVAGGTKNAVEQAVGKSSLLAGRVCPNTVNQIVTVACIVQKSASRYIDGEINGKEFIQEVGQEGTVMVAGMIGGEVGKEIGTLFGAVAGTMLGPAGVIVGSSAGAVVGQVLGTVISTVACSALISVYNVAKSINRCSLQDQQVRRLEREALHAIKNQREKFIKIVQNENLRWDQTVRQGFDQMLTCACKETFDMRGTVEGLDMILGLFGQKAAFHDISEYENQLDQTITLKF